MITLHDVGSLPVLIEYKNSEPIMFQNFLYHSKGIPSRPLDFPFFINDKAVVISSKVINFSRCLLYVSSIDVKPVKYISILSYTTGSTVKKII